MNTDVYESILGRLDSRVGEKLAMSEFQVLGDNDTAAFTLKLHRGDGVALIAMNWKADKPPKDFVGFAIECKPPDLDRFYPLRNRLAFRTGDGNLDPTIKSTMISPIQMFRWVHFPPNADLDGKFVYRVTPVFMNEHDELSYGEPQEAAVELRRDTYPGLLNVTFTRGFVSSQAFVDRYESSGPISKLLPTKASAGLDFRPSHPKAQEALKWMGFEAVDAILEVLDKAIADKDANVFVIAYDLNEREVVTRLKKLKKRLKIIIDDSKEHGGSKSSESRSAKLLEFEDSDNVKRQHMLNLQHNKIIIVDSANTKLVVCGSTNFSWRGFYVQSNNAIIMQGANAIKPFKEAFESYWVTSNGDFGSTTSAGWRDLGLDGIDARVAFSPHSQDNALLQEIADDIEKNTNSSLFFSLAFLYQTTGPIRDAIKKMSKRNDIFVYGISDRKVGGLDIQRPADSVPTAVYPSALTKDVPEPFSKEPTGGGGIRMHHKFIVIDFDKPTARVYLGSYNFSTPADVKNGENLLLIRDRRIAVSYVVEALRIFDHYHFRVKQLETPIKELVLEKPPRKAGEKAWWDKYYTDNKEIKDRELFS